MIFSEDTNENTTDEVKEDSNALNAAATGLVAELSFFGNYSEPDLRVPLSPYLKQAIANIEDQANRDTFEFVCRLTMDIETKQWTVDVLSENGMTTQSQYYSRAHAKTKLKLEEFLQNHQGR